MIKPNLHNHQDWFHFFFLLQRTLAVTISLLKTVIRGLQNKGEIFSRDVVSQYVKAHLDARSRVCPHLQLSCFAILYKHLQKPPKKQPKKTKNTSLFRFSILTKGRHYFKKFNRLTELFPLKIGDTLKHLEAIFNLFSCLNFFDVARLKEDWGVLKRKQQKNNVDALNRISSVVRL